MKLVVVMEREHPAQVPFMVFGKTAAWGKAIGFPERPEEAIPSSNVAIVESVQIELMVDGMMFGPLNEVANPARSAKIAVIEIFAYDGEDVEPNTTSGR